MNTSESLLSKIKELENLKTDIDGASVDAKKVRSACVEINKSWSGSSLTNHAKFYFENYQEPPVENRFNIEWGLIHGVPEGWTERTNKEVNQEIETKTSVNLETLKEKAANFEEKFESLKKDIVLQLVGAGASDIADIEGFKLKSATDYFNEIFPTSFMTRDMTAISSGTYVVPHYYFEAIAMFILGASSQVDNFVYKLNKKMATQQAPNKQEPSDFTHIHKNIREKCLTLYTSGAYAEAVEKSFKIVKDELRTLTGFETGSEAFGKGGLHIKGAAAQNVDDDFNQAAKFLMMAIDMFRNEKSHTSDAKIVDPIRAYQYLAMSSLALSLLENSEIKSK